MKHVLRADKWLVKSALMTARRTKKDARAKRPLIDRRDDICHGLCTRTYIRTHGDDRSAGMGEQRQAFRNPGFDAPRPAITYSTYD